MSSHNSVVDLDHDAPPISPLSADRWYPVATVAAHIGIEPVSLRRRLARHARRTPDGIVAAVDGFDARKFGGEWRVRPGRWA